MVKHLFMVTKLVSGREFEPRSVVSRPNLLSPYVALPLLWKKEEEEEEEEEKEEEKEKKKEEEGP